MADTILKSEGALMMVDARFGSPFLCFFDLAFMSSSISSGRGWGKEGGGEGGRGREERREGGREERREGGKTKEEIVR